MLVEASNGFRAADSFVDNTTTAGPPPPPIRRATNAPGNTGATRERTEATHLARHRAIRIVSLHMLGASSRDGRWRERGSLRGGTPRMHIACHVTHCWACGTAHSCFSFGPAIWSRMRCAPPEPDGGSGTKTAMALGRAADGRISRAGSCIGLAKQESSTTDTHRCDVPLRRSHPISHDGVSRWPNVLLGPSAFVCVYRWLNLSSAWLPADRERDKCAILRGGGGDRVMRCGIGAGVGSATLSRINGWSSRRTRGSTSRCRRWPVLGAIRKVTYAGGRKFNPKEAP